ncbi:Flp pilus assembly protein CpaB [Isoalcanivorax beigongshangi]|uniref:Flp pilus assembly protein CpaB n=1 Tax=Isoalcanivorax beigongshangi TaxID=3238810 RepID=A0ABV4AFE2_9GAMM
MGARWLYMLPALLLSAIAVVLAIMGLAREPAPAPNQAAPGIVMQVTEQQIEDALKHSYWVATRELGIGAQISENDFRKVGVSVPLVEALPSDQSVVGTVLRRNVREGEILARSHLQPANKLAQVVPAGYRAVAIAIDNVSAVGGFLKAGDLVDILAHFRNGGDDDRQPTAMVVLSSIEVLAVHGRMEEPSTEDERQQEQQRGRNATAVLAVPREDLSRLMLAEANGALRLALAGQGREHRDGDETETATADGKPSSADAAAALARFEDLFPKKQRAPARPAAPRGDRVEVFEGSSSRSTYVH